MTGAFDGGAYDSVAFDVGEEVATPSYGGTVRRFAPQPAPLPNDDDALIAWFVMEEM